MDGDQHSSTRRLHAVGGEDPIWRLWAQLPEPWKMPVIGDGIADWKKITENGERRLDLTGLPDPIPAELAWMSHWQALDGTRSSVLATNQLANILRRAIRECHPFPPSIRAMGWEAAAALQRWFYATRWGRLPPHGSIARLRVIFRFARLALLARCLDGPWWALDEWHPRCDPRIPLAEHEPQAHYGCSPAKISHPWLREAVKWSLGTHLEAGILRWSTVSQERMRCLVRFDRWLSTTRADPLDVLGDPADAVQQAAAFRRWDADPANRLTRRAEQRFAQQPTTTCGRSPSSLRSSPPTPLRPARSSGRTRGRVSRTRMRPAGSARSPASRTSGNSTTSTTSTTTHSRRSPRLFPCSGSAATSRC